MKTYKWSVHDKSGKEVRSGETTVETNNIENYVMVECQACEEEWDFEYDTKESTNVIQNIQDKEGIDFSHYHEFRVKEV